MGPFDSHHSPGPLPMAPQLIYFGLPESIRQTLKAGNVEFEDVRLTQEEFQQRKATGEFAFGQLPVLVLDNGTKVTQSNAILRWAGKQSGLYPQDDTLALQVDEVLDGIEDFVNMIRPGLRTADEAEKKAKIEEAVAGPCVPYLQGLEALAVRNGSNGYFVGNSTTIADMKLTELIGFMTSGFFPGLNAAVIEPYPNLLAIMNKHKRNEN